MKSLFVRKLAKRRRSNENGAALVEAAIIFVPLCLIVFGIIEYGFIFKDSLTLSSATRAGARTASAMPKTPPAQFSDIVSKSVEKAASAATFKPGDEMWIYKADTNGAAPDACATNCFKFTYNGNGNWTQSGTWDTQNGINACLGGPNPGGDIDSVGVRLSLTHDAITGFFHGMNLHERTVMKFEPTTSSGC